MDDSLYKKFISILRGQQQPDFVYTEPKYIFSRLLQSCVAGDKHKKFKLEDTITLTQIKDLLKKQNNKCAISGIDFINSDVDRFPFRMSVDRIDSSKGHTPENCQLICMAIQFGKSNKSNDETIKYVKEIMERK
ncbi:hypothetical protein Klosneuvirus_2_125 [Klosneuvirus KNV1]|uniref:Uncharacterized protein n=1 Tax=Klosneuvirus KNV1 TaxID=1977640 RepID=A0A1V0SJ02_9VIRU|nr:hypothetical protein Klosneuvirus_2_125 [Klosneuvirus KNV1]